MGVNVVELDGWEEAQGQYFWTDLDSGQRGYDQDPTAYMIHHTGSSVARPTVRDSSGRWSKANCWAGLWDGSRLNQTGSGTPTIVFTAAGPARISSGYGHGPTLNLVAADFRVGWDQRRADTNKAANRFAWNVETVAAGNGSDIDPGVEEALIKMGALLASHYGWSPWRAIGHLTWTKRKLDPFWNSQQDRIVYLQNEIEQEMKMVYRDVINVPNAGWAHGVVDDGIESGLIVTADAHVDDWEDDKITMGRLWTLFSRMMPDQDRP
jgi:hypothetical protein